MEVSGVGGGGKVVGGGPGIPAESARRTRELNLKGVGPRRRMKELTWGGMGPSF